MDPTLTGRATRSSVKTRTKQSASQDETLFTSAPHSPYLTRGSLRRASSRVASTAQTPINAGGDGAGFEDSPVPSNSRRVLQNMGQHQQPSRDDYGLVSDMSSTPAQPHLIRRMDLPTPCPTARRGFGGWSLRNSLAPSAVDDDDLLYNQDSVVRRRHRASISEFAVQATKQNWVTIMTVFSLFLFTAGVIRYPSMRPWKFIPHQSLTPRLPTGSGLVGNPKQSKRAASLKNLTSVNNFVGEAETAVAVSAEHAEAVRRLEGLAAILEERMMTLEGTLQKKLNLYSDQISSVSKSLAEHVNSDISEAAAQITANDTIGKAELAAKLDATHRAVQNHITDDLSKLSSFEERLQRFSSEFANKYASLQGDVEKGLNRVTELELSKGSHPVALPVADDADADAGTSAGVSDDNGVFSAFPEGPLYSRQSMMAILKQLWRDVHESSTGTMNWAQQSAGASIVAALTSPGFNRENFIENTLRCFSFLPTTGRWLGLTDPASKPPEVVISADNGPGRQAGDCFTMNGAGGNVTIQLPRAVVVYEVAVEHAAPSLIRSVQTAPRLVNVWGFVAEEYASARAFYELTKQPHLLAENLVFDYPKYLIQKFPVAVPTARGCRLTAREAADAPDPNCGKALPLRRVTFEVRDNYGAERTCLYRVRVHGDAAL